MNNRNDGSQYIDDYSSLEPLAMRIETHKTFSRYPDDVNAAVRDAADLAGDESLLDIGCGTGSFLLSLTREGHNGQLTGVDTSEAAIQKIQKNRNISALLSDAVSLPFASEEFDVVLARHMLYHVSDLRAALREAHRVTRSHGKFVAVVNHPNVTPKAASLVKEAAIASGFDPPKDSVNWIHSDNLGQWLSPPFSSVGSFRHDNALVFDDPRPLIQFASALTSFYGVPPDAPGKGRVLAAIESKAKEWFAAGHGPWLDPKGYTIFVAKK